MHRTTTLTRPWGLLVAGLLALGTTAATAPAPAQADPAPSFNAFTLNVAFTMSTARATSDAVHAMSLGSVGGFQEYSGRADREALARAASARGWGIYMPDNDGKNVPIVWDARRFSPVSGQSVSVYGAQGRLSKARMINVVRLRDRLTGRVYGVLNTHTISGGARSGEPTGSAARVSLLRRHIAAIRGAITTLSRSSDAVIAIGDWNVNYLNDRVKHVAGFPTATLGDLVNFDMPGTGSHGRASLLDYVVSTKSSTALTFAGSRIAGSFHSDHDAVVTTYRPTS